MDINERKTVSRRGFVRTATVSAGVAVLGTSLRALPAVPAETPRALPRRVLGRTKLEVTCMTLGSAPCGIARDVSVEEVGRITNLAIDLGINFIDTAPKYSKAEEGIGRVLGRRRKDIFLATKVWADTIAEAEKSLANSLRTLKTDYFDVLYFHNLGGRVIEGAREADGVFAWLLRQKQAGKCRFVGVSGHNLPGRFPPFLETGDVDVLLVPVNYVDRHTYRFEEDVLPIARKHDVGIVAMKVFGAPDKKTGSWHTRKAEPTIGKQNIELAVRYALSVPGVATANLGVHTAEQLRKNVEIVNRFLPLEPDELKAAVETGKKLAPEWGPHFGPVKEETVT